MLHPPFDQSPIYVCLFHFVYRIFKRPGGLLFSSLLIHTKNKGMKKTFALIASGIAGLCLASFEQKPNTNFADDGTFAKMAYMGNCAEISAGNLAIAKAQNPQVAALGRMMVADHTAANAQLMTIVKDIDRADSLDAEHQSLKDSLMNLGGADFDKAYVQSQVKDHQTAISLFQEEAANGKKKELKAYANKLLPKLKSHLEHVNKLASM